MNKNFFLLFMVSIFVSGCGANFNSIFRVTETENGTRVALLDAKQRAISISRGPFLDEEIVCAEPSPDGLSALAAAGSGSIDIVDEVSALFQGSSVETATNIGLRTPSVQALRDAMYRSCEAYAAGGITESEYNGLLRRYQNILLGLIAIEQVTGTITPQPVVIGGNAEILTGEALVKAQELLNQAELKLATATKTLEEEESKKTKLESELESLKKQRTEEPDTAKHPGLDGQIAAKQKEIENTSLQIAESQKIKKEALLNRDAQIAIRDAARQPNIGISSQATFANVSTQTKSEASKDVAKEVKEIVADIVREMHKHDLVTTCLSSLARNADRVIELSNLSDESFSKITPERQGTIDASESVINRVCKTIIEKAVADI